MTPVEIYVFPKIILLKSFPSKRLISMKLLFFIDKFKSWH